MPRRHPELQTTARKCSAASPLAPSERIPDGRNRNTRTPHEGSIVDSLCRTRPPSSIKALWRVGLAVRSDMRRHPPSRSSPDYWTRTISAPRSKDFVHGLLASRSATRDPLRLRESELQCSTVRRRWAESAIRFDDRHPTTASTCWHLPHSWAAKPLKDNHSFGYS